jgi:acylphosphatase
MIIARRLLITGRVQGVGFRWFAMERAALEGITGWVRNLPTGQVEVVAEGEADAMERFERAVRQGPPRGRVDEVATEIVPPTGRHITFEGRN